MKELSCGIIILNECDEILMGHSTGNTFYDLPKGGMEEGETFLECALRECWEETGLDFSGFMMTELGLVKYTKKKDLHLYVIPVIKQAIDMESLVCTTNFLEGEREFPEFDGYRWVSIDELDEYCTTNMARVLTDYMKGLY